MLATVVWSRAPSSGKPGSTALITPDRTDPRMARRRVRRAHGDPRGPARAGRGRRRKLLFLGTPEELEAHRRDGVVTVPIACQSEGALEVYVEPGPAVAAAHRDRALAAVDALAGMGGALGWRTVVVDDGGDPEAHPSAGGVMTELDLSAVDARSFVVVATQGHYDEEALERALATPAAYVGLVASRKRAAAVLGYLRDRGVAQEAIDRVHAPAGLGPGPASEPRRSRWRSSPSWCSCAASGELAGGVAPDTVARAPRGDRPRLRDDRGRGHGPVPHQPRGRHLLLLLGRVPRTIHEGPRGVRVGRRDDRRTLARHADRERVHRDGARRRLVELPAGRGEDRALHARRRAHRGRGRQELEGQAEREVRTGGRCRSPAR